MFEMSNEANVAYQICTGCVEKLQALTVKCNPKSVDDAKDFSNAVRKEIAAFSSSFELFVAGACAELRKKGVFPTVLPTHRRTVLYHAEERERTIAASRSLALPTIASRSSEQIPAVGVSGGTSSGTGTGGGGGGKPPGAGALPLFEMSSEVPLSQQLQALLTPRHQQQQQSESRESIVPMVSKGMQAPQFGTPKHAGAGEFASNEQTGSPPGSGGGALGSITPSYMPTTGSTGFVAAATGRPAIGIGCCNPQTETVESIVSTGLYMQFEALVRHTLAREAALFVYAPNDRSSANDEAQAIALFGGKPRPPHNVRIPLKTGVVGAVIRSGIAVNITPENVSETNHYALCFPIFPVSGKLAPVGAILLEKKTTNTPFTKEDEEVVHQWCKLISHVMTEYAVNLTQVYFDPYRILLKKVQPVPLMQKRGQLTSVPRWMETPPESSNLLANIEQLLAQTSSSSSSSRGPQPQQQHSTARAIVGGTYSPRLAGLVSSYNTQQLIFHTVHHNHFTTLRGAHIGGAGVTLQTQNLMDVADYVSSLEDCWKRAADDLQGMEIEHVSRMDDFRDRKKKLKSAHIRMNQLEAVCDYYKNKYESMKAELTLLCGAPVGDDDSLDGPSPISPLVASTAAAAFTQSGLVRTASTGTTKKPSRTSSSVGLDGAERGGGGGAHTARHPSSHSLPSPPRGAPSGSSKRVSLAPGS